MNLADRLMILTNSARMLEIARRSNDPEVREQLSDIVSLWLEAAGYVPASRSRHDEGGSGTLH